MTVTQSTSSLPVWFRVMAALAVAWNLFGVVMYLSSVGLFGDPTTAMSEAERAAAASIPPWITAAFAIGTFAGLIGSVGLLLRKLWALPVLVVSLAALLVLEGWTVFLSGALEAFGGVALPAVISLVAVLLVWLALQAKGKGWLS